MKKSRRTLLLIVMATMLVAAAAEKAPEKENVGETVEVGGKNEGGGAGKDKAYRYGDGSLVRRVLHTYWQTQTESHFSIDELLCNAALGNLTEWLINRTQSGDGSISGFMVNGGITKERETFEANIDGMVSSLAAHILEGVAESLKDGGGESGSLGIGGGSGSGRPHKVKWTYEVHDSADGGSSLTPVVVPNDRFDLETFIGDRDDDEVEGGKKKDVHFEAAEGFTVYIPDEDAEPARKVLKKRPVANSGEKQTELRLRSYPVKYIFKNSNSSSPAVVDTGPAQPPLGDGDASRAAAARANFYRSDHTRRASDLERRGGPAEPEPASATSAVQPQPAILLVQDLLRDALTRGCCWFGGDRIDDGASRLGPPAAASLALHSETADGAVSRRPPLSATGGGFEAAQQWISLLLVRIPASSTAAAAADQSAD